ncbi:hypothetical protein L245_00285 [Salmonella enterica subsp. enterica serovar Worthington str. BCH-4719]|nr:hypothetical protein L245_00285 [Salmonella enterica subsp. enterica serovar Worthington str. BCH-4719]
MEGEYSELAILLSCNTLFLLVFVFIPQVIHRLAVKFLDLVFKILFLILVLGVKFINKINML